MARMCSGCGEIFLEPTLGATTEEKGTILTEEFLHHLAKAYENEDGTLRPGIDRDGYLFHSPHRNRLWFRFRFT